MLHDGAGGALVVVIDVEPALARPALLLGVAVQALGNEKVADLAVSAVREVVVHALLAGVLVQAVPALGEGAALDALAVRWVELVLDALAANTAALADLAASDVAGAELAGPLLKEVVDTVALGALVLAGALGAVGVEGAAPLALGRVEVVGGELAGHALVCTAAVEAALEALRAEVAAALGGVVAVRHALGTALLQAALHAGRELLRALNAAVLIGVQRGRVALGALR